MITRALGDWRLVARAGVALVLANARYWTTVAPTVRGELKRWEHHAQGIEDPALRALALTKLHDEGLHAAAAAMLATTAPRAHRRGVAEAIVAVEVLFDYLDGLTERASADPLGDGQRAFGALIAAVAVTRAVTEGAPALPPGSEDGGYLETLSRAAALALAPLPAASVIAGVAKRSAERSAQAQTRMHAVPALGTAQLEEWATAHSSVSGLGWREFAAGAASSVLVLHALIAAAADPRTTSREAGEIAAAYEPVCVLLTLLDGLIDYEHDRASSDGAGYTGLYDEPSELPAVLRDAARRAVAQLRTLRGGAHHVMILTGVTAYYASAPGARGEFARPAIARLQEELAPLMSPTLAIIRVWRWGRRRRSGTGPLRRGDDAPGWQSEERREVA
jgi:tetraprenyl-beta-curcumene synthase